MSGAVGTAIVASALASAAIGAASSVYAAGQQKKAQEEATRAREAAAKAERDRLAKIESEKRPEEASATVEFGEKDTSGFGSYDDFLVGTSKSTSALGSTSGSGLSSSTLSSLGMK